MSPVSLPISRRLPAPLVATLLLLGGCASSPLPPLPTQTQRSCAPPPGSYKVKSGDTLFRIAWAYCVDHRDLARWNRLSNPDLILVGQQLRLRPAGGRVAPVAAAPVRNRAKPRRDRQAPPRPAVAAVDRPAPPVAPTAPAPRRSGAWRWPAEGKVISSFDPAVPGRNGIRIRVAKGQPVRAASPGQIVYTGNSLPGYGTLIIVEHGKGLLSAYGRLGRMLVGKGDRVGAGDAIAEPGGVGDATLHFEIRKDGQPVDPMGYLSG